MDETSSAPVHAVVFPGTTEEREELFAAVTNHCSCGPESPDGQPDACAPHGLLLLEPTLKRLVFFRRWHRARTQNAAAAAD